jgi:putative acetyltransferase
MQIQIDDLLGADIARLLQAHLDEMYLHSPPESVHALDLDALRRPEITFWAVRDADGILMGCGALKQLDPTHGEIKSMRTASSHRGKGVATRLMRHMLEEARHRGYRRLSLETGSMEFFEPARELYRRFGFELCGPFAEYIEDPYSVFMTLAFEAPLTQM